MQVEWTNRALTKVQEQADYISMESMALAGRWVEKLFNTTQKMLSDQPEIGRMVPFLDSKSIREIIIGSYRVIYKVAFEEGYIYILTVRSCREDIAEDSYLD